MELFSIYTILPINYINLLITEIQEKIFCDNFDIFIFITFNM